MFHTFTEIDRADMLKVFEAEVERRNESRNALPKAQVVAELAYERAIKIRNMLRDNGAPRIHHLKCQSPWFGDVRYGLKHFEVRVNDRDYRRGDLVILYRYDPGSTKQTGENCAFRIDYILQGGQFGIDEESCVLGFKTAI